MTLHALWLDYQQPPPGRHWPGIALLALSISLTGTLLYQYHLVNQSLEIKEKKVTHLKRQAELNRLQEENAESNKNTDEIAKQTTRIAEHWESLFAALEDAGDDTVTLIGIAPRLHEVSVIGEAKDIGSALEYLKRLQSSKALSNVHITEQEILKDHPRHPLRFTLVTGWPEMSR